MNAPFAIIELGPEPTQTLVRLPNYAILSISATKKPSVSKSPGNRRSAPSAVRELCNRSAPA